MQSALPFFSIIIPTYNRANIIRETIQSVCEQTFENWEIIIVDDGSTDNTSQVIKQISESNPRIRYIFQKNAERSVARNNGAEHANGQFLLFLDSDDKYAPEHLEKLKRFINSKNDPVALFFTNVSYLTDEGIKIPSIPVMQAGNEFEYMLLQPITPSRVCIHKEIFNYFRFDPKIVIVEDLVLWVSIATKFPVFQLCENTLLYRIHEGNSVGLDKNSYLDRYKGLLRLFNDPDYARVSTKIPQKIRKHLLAECCFNMARHFEFVKKYGRMNQMLVRSFTFQPFYRNKERLYMFLSHFPLTSSLINRSK
jgi:glycosyltransferase involved in cell wall biosynthesis